MAALVAGGAAQAAPLDPTTFASLGASPFGTAGVFTVTANKNNAAPTLNGPGIGDAISGGDEVLREAAHFVADDSSHTMSGQMSSATGMRMGE